MRIQGGVEQEELDRIEDADYNSELEELRGILQAWDKPLKIEIVIGGNIGPFTKLMEMLEDVRTTNNNLLFVVIMYMA